MIRTVFFDLDGTLLPIDTNTFLRDYFSALAAYSTQTGQDPKHTLAAIKTGILAMIDGNPETTVAERFWQCFFTQVDPQACDWKSLFDRFYREQFPLLGKDVLPSNAMVNALAAIQKQGLQVVLATNPLFPADAVHCRLKWAGIDPSSFLYITSYENSHFSKPDPRYYQELLDILQLKGSETLMVGNDLVEDGSARACGCELYLVDDYLMLPHDADEHALDAIHHGSSADFLAFANDLTLA